MRVLFLVPRLDKASTRYRVLQYLPYLQEQGVSCRVRTLSKDRGWDRSLFREARSSDVVFLQKRILSPFLLLALRKASSRLVYDLDDAVMFRDEAATETSRSFRWWKFALTARLADRVVAGNAYLKEQTLPHNPNVQVLPTPLDMSRYTPRSSLQSPKKACTLGWIGSRPTLRHLEVLSPVFLELGRRHPDLRLKIVADAFPDGPTLPVIAKRWDFNEEISDLHSFDIGLMPLNDDVWSRGKCGFKLLQYMAVGLPAVCSPIGLNREIVEHGRNGLWADSPREWIDRLEELLEDPSRRTSLGSRARETVLERYSLAVNAPLFARILAQVTDSPLFGPAG